MLVGQATRFGPQQARPMILARDAGNWVRISRSKSYNLKPGSSYSVYRQMLVDDKSEGGQHIAIRETGAIRVEKVFPSFILGRIKEQLQQDGGVSVGHMVVP